LPGSDARNSKNKFMKAILIFTAALMTGASIYGVASYKQLADTKDFKELYTGKEESSKSEAITTKVALEKKEPAITETKKFEEKLAATKKMKRKPSIGKKDEMKTEVIAIEEISAEPSVQESFEGKPSVEIKEEATSTTRQQSKKVKKLKRNMFSRAALKDE